MIELAHQIDHSTGNHVAAFVIGVALVLLIVMGGSRK